MVHGRSRVYDSTYAPPYNIYVSSFGTSFSACLHAYTVCTQTHTGTHTLTLRRSSASVFKKPPIWIGSEEESGVHMYCGRMPRILSIITRPLLGACWVVLMPRKIAGSRLLLSVLPGRSIAKPQASFHVIQRGDRSRRARLASACDLLLLCTRASFGI